MVGYMLGGGYSFMFWMFGMVVDNFLELEFVIVDGCIVVVND